MITTRVLAFEQSAGTFYLSSMSAEDLIKIYKVNRRSYNPITGSADGGIQRELSSKRVNDIAEYATSPDASFPTPIILALSEDTYQLDGDTLTIEESNTADVVDGQHRIEGIKKSGVAYRFSLPVVFLLEPTEEEKALLFATINGKQTTVPASVVYDLFDVAKTRSPQKTAHEIARALNSIDTSPWKYRLKMLGKKTKGSDESLSQGTFVKFLLPHISGNPTQDMKNIKEGKEPAQHNCIFNEYFRTEQDEIILKILINVFNSVKSTWLNEWNNPDQYVLSKTTGYSGVMRALPDLVAKGRLNSDLTQSFFDKVFLEAKNIMNAKGIELTSDDFFTSAKGEAQFRDIIKQALEAI